MFQESSVQDLTMNPFEKVNKQWMLITAGDEKGFNTMTASWGGLGVIWQKPVATVYLRPQRYTKEFVDAAAEMSISVLPEAYRKELNYFGTVSGRDEDKIAKSGLGIAEENGVPYFADARLAFICKKLYAQPLEADCFIDKSNIERWYPGNDFHTMYVVEIEKVLTA